MVRIVIQCPSLDLIIGLPFLFGVGLAIAAPPLMLALVVLVDTLRGR